MASIITIKGRGKSLLYDVYVVDFRIKWRENIKMWPYRVFCRKNFTLILSFWSKSELFIRVYPRFHTFYVFNVECVFV